VNGPVEVTKGSPDDEELAAVVIALEMVAARAVASEPAPVSKWRSSLGAGSTNVSRNWRSRG
jgi:Acyl-CoA carboxylase epsilon subunit